MVTGQRRAGHEERNSCVTGKLEDATGRGASFSLTMRAPHNEKLALAVRYRSVRAALVFRRYPSLCHDRIARISRPPILRHQEANPVDTTEIIIATVPGTV